MKFTTFPFVNRQLGPAEGDEETVYSMPAYEGPHGFAAFCSIEDDVELQQIIATRGIWINVSTRQWSPMAVSAFPFAFNPLQIICFNLLAERLNANQWRDVGVIHYLDLTFVYLRLEPGDRVGPVKSITDPEKLRGYEYTDQDGQSRLPEAVTEVQYYTEGDLEPKGGKYLFGQDLQLLGPISNFPRLKPFQDIHDFLTDEVLVLMKPDRKPSKIISLDHAARR